MFTVMVLETQTRTRLAEVDWAMPNLVFCAFFMSEWALGLLLVANRSEYLRDPMKIADFVSSIPFGYFFQGLRLVRLLRLMRITRVVLRARRFRGRGARAVRMIGVVGAPSFAGALALRIVEPETVESFYDALWWAIVTLSTVGYGDIMPQTGPGKAVAAVLIVIGIGVFGYVAGFMTSLLQDREDDETLVALDRLHREFEALSGDIRALREQLNDGGGS